MKLYYSLPLQPSVLPKGPAIVQYNYDQRTLA